MEPQKRMNVKKAWDLSKEWKRASIIWKLLDHFFAVGSFAASVSVLYVGAQSNNDSLIILLSSIAAVFTLMGYACNPIGLMTNYRMAFEILNDALIASMNDKGEFSGKEEDWNKIQEAITAGEKHIGNVFGRRNN